MDIRPQDLKLPGAGYHTSLGAVRTKPGRGDPTRSLSCSDKMLKWRALGMQVPSITYFAICYCLLGGKVVIRYSVSCKVIEIELEAKS